MNNENPKAIMELKFPILEDSRKALNEIQSRNIENQNLKLASIYQLGYQTLQSLAIFSKLCTCTDDVKRIVELPYNLFHWDLDSFIERQQHDFIWHDITLTEFTTECIEARKGAIDSEELMKYFCKIFQNYLDHKPIDDVIRALNSCSACLALSDTIDSDIKNEETYLSNEIALYGTAELKKQNTIMNLMYTFSEKTELLAPAERNQLKNIATKIEMARLRLHIKETKLQNKVKFYNTHFYNDILCSNYKTLSYYTDIENLQEKVNYWSKHYDDQYDKFDSAIYKVTREIDEIQERKLKMEESLEFFRARLKAHAIAEQKMRELLELQDSTKKRMKSSKRKRRKSRVHTI